MRNGQTKRNLKLFYSIKRVSRLFDVKESTLRYWEEEFKELNPRKTKEEFVNIDKRIFKSLN